MKKYIIISIISIFGINSFSQTYTLRAPHINSHKHFWDSYFENFSFEARDYIKLEDGFHFTANDDNKKFTAKINPNLIFSTNYNDEQTAWTSDLPVGSLPGSVNVIPTGAATYNIPIALPPGTAGMMPNLSINYNSQSDNGMLGRGWTIGGFSAITRVPATLYHDGFVGGVNFNGNDKFALDGQRLIQTNKDDYEYGEDGAIYHTENESFSEIRSFYHSGAGNGPAYFEVKTKNGLNLKYNHPGNFSNKTPGDDDVMYWLLTEVSDVHENYYKIDYMEYNGMYYPSELSYTGNYAENLPTYNKIKFYYTKKADRRITFVAGTAYKKELILSDIKIYNNGGLIRKYHFKHTYNSFSQLSEIQLYEDKDKTINTTKINWGEEKNYDLKNFNFPESDIAINSFINGDFNGDGRTDVVFLKMKRDGDGNAVFENGLHVYEKWQYYTITNNGNFILRDAGSLNSNAFFYTGDFNGDGKTDILKTIINDGKYYNSFLISKGNEFESYPAHFFNTSHISSQFKLGDFNGNGKTDVAILTQEGNKSRYRIFKEYNEETPSIHPMIVDMYTAEDDIIDQMHVVNFNGNGKSDLMFIYESYDNSCRIFEYKYLENDINNSMVELYNSGYPTKDHKIYNGDFNGDGKTDILTWVESAEWEIFYSNGIGYTNEGLNINFDHDGDPEESSADNNYIISDFNGDGRDDILERYSNYSTQEGKFNFFYNQGSSFIKKSYNISFSDFDITMNTLVKGGDFNGDGKLDLLSYEGGDFVMMYMNPSYSTRPYEHTHLVKSIIDGYNNKTQFDYKPLTDASVYIKGSGASFPVIDYQGAIYVVKNLKTPNGIGTGTTTQNYKYESAKIHRQGKGFLGFMKVKSENLTTHIISETEFEYNTTYFNTYPVSSKTYYINFDTYPISSSTILNQHIHHFEDKRIFSYPKETESKNHLTNTTVSSITDIDVNTGNLTSTKKSTEDGYTETLYQNYITAGSWLPTKPKKTIINKKVTGKSLYSRTSNFEYYDNGMLKKSIADPYDATNKIITEYWYNSFGNVEHTKVSAPGDSEVGDKHSYLAYDNKNRFVTSQKDPLNFTSYKTYDTETGNILTQTDINGHVTKFKYNAFGSLIKTELPDGTKAYQTTEWYLGNNIANAKTYTITSADGTTPVKSYFDKLGRKIRTESSGFNDETIVAELEYNSKGQVYKTYEPHFEGETGNSTTFNFDKYGRQTSIISPIGTTSYSYNEKITTVIMPDEQQTSKTINSLGQVITAEDYGGTINYKYNSAGLPDTISTVGGAEIIMTYDNYGNKLSLKDPDAGTINYTYYAFSNIKTQKDAKNNLVRMEYDIAGRLIEKTGSDGTTYYNYDTATNGKGMLASETYNGNTKKFVYDNLSRMQSVTETFEGEEYTYSYNYDNLGRISKMTYPNGFAYTKHYKDNGSLDKIKRADNGALIWEINTINAYGQTTQFSKGNGLVTNNTYDQISHMPETVITGTIQNMVYDFEHTTGNLLSRTDNIHANTESFIYDNLDRLTDINTNGNIFSTFYDETGNITSKTDAGIYSYNDSKHIHAVTNVTANVYVPSQQQKTSYTSFNKILQISEGLQGNTPPDIKLNFTYGLNQQRKKTELFESGEITQTKYYFGSYEKTIEADGTVKEYCFIPGGAIYKTTNGISEMLYTYTDHLGSVTHITDATGNLLAEQSFGAWGRMRDPVTWEYTTDNSQSSIINGRGYTGHEMLPKFGLINMNGRLYDPILGRMLSPDNYVQASSFTQSFNRYSYVVNNPLKYTDPTGQWWGYDDAIVAGVGFAVGYISYGVKTKDWGWSAVGAGAIGATMAWVTYNTAGLATGAITANTWNFAASIGVNAYINQVMPIEPLNLNENWSLTLQPSFFYSTAGFGAGLIGGIHYTNNKGFSASVYGSAQFGNSFVAHNNYEFRLGAQVNFTGKNSHGSIGFNQFFSGETSQWDWLLGFGGKKWSFQLEEDFPVSDKYRTGAGKFSYKYDEDIELSLGFNTYTGTPNDTKNKVYRFYNKNGKIERCYVRPEAYKYLFGGLYAGVNYKGQTFQAGMNSEKIRGFFQNGIHSGINSLFKLNGTDGQIPHFIERPDLNPNSFYYNYGTINPFSLYP